MKMTAAQSANNSGIALEKRIAALNPIARSVFCTMESAWMWIGAWRLGTSRGMFRRQVEAHRALRRRFGKQQGDALGENLLVYAGSAGMDLEARIELLELSAMLADSRRNMPADQVAAGVKHATERRAFHE